MIYQKIKNYILVVLMLASCQVVNAQYDNPIVIEIATPKVKLVDNKGNLSKTIKSQIQECIFNALPQVHIVDRQYEEYVALKRKNMSKTDLGLVAVGALGANYILESKLSEITEKLDSASYKKYSDKGKLSKIHLAKVTRSYTINMELVSVETGEAVAKAAFTPEGWSYQKFKKSKPRTFETTVHEALVDQKFCFQSTLRYMITNVLPLKLDVIALDEVKKDKVKKILIAGGKSASYNKDLKYEIVKIYQQELGGKKIDRQEKIGEAKFDKNIGKYSVCKVKNGAKEVLVAFNAGDKLYCVPMPIDKAESCSGYLIASGTRSKKSSYKSLASNDSKPTSKAAKDKADKKDASNKRIQSKKVTKKSGGK